jgi:hypothetical protein
MDIRSAGIVPRNIADVGFKEALWSGGTFKMSNGETITIR